MTVLCTHCGGTMLLDVGLEAGEPDQLKCVSCGRAPASVRAAARARAAGDDAEVAEFYEGKARRRQPSHGKLKL